MDYLPHSVLVRCKLCYDAFFIPNLNECVCSCGNLSVKGLFMYPKCNRDIEFIDKKGNVTSNEHDEDDFIHGECSDCEGNICCIDKIKEYRKRKCNEKSR